MSLGRYDPNAAKLRYIPPEQYERNLANIAQAKATIETFEKMNDEGRRRHEQMQKEELELERRVQEGLLASQRLQQLRDLKTSIDLQANNGNRGEFINSARIEEVSANKQMNFPPDHQSSSRQQSYVPTSNNSYLPSSQQEIPRKRDSLYRPQTHTHYSSGLTNSNVRNIQSMPQSNYGPSRRTSYSDSSRSGYNLAPTYYSDVPYQTNVYQPSTNLRQTSSYSTQTNQYRSTSQVEGQLSHTPITSTQGVNVQQSAQASDSHEPTQFSFTAHQHQQGYQNSKSMYHSPKAGISPNTSSSLAGALGTVEATTPTSTVNLTSPNNKIQDPPSTSMKEKETSVPSRNNFNIPISIPPLPTRQYILDLKDTLMRWNAQAPAGSLFPSTITFRGIPIRCVKQGNGSVFLVIPTLSGVPAYHPLNNFINHFLQTYGDFSPANTTPVATSSTSTQNDQLQGGMVPTTVLSAQLPSFPPAQEQVNQNIVPTQGDPATVTQSIPLPIVPIVPSGPAPAHPTSGLPAMLDNVSPPEKKEHSTPVRTPLDANLKHLAHDILYNLGKRRRENADASEQMAKRRLSKPPPHAQIPSIQNNIIAGVTIQSSIDAISSTTSIVPPTTNLSVGNTAERSSVNHPTSQVPPPEATLSSRPEPTAPLNRLSNVECAPPVHTSTTQVPGTTSELNGVADSSPMSFKPTSVPSTTPVTSEASLHLVTVTPDASLVPQIATIQAMDNVAQENDTPSEPINIIDLTSPDPSPPRFPEPDIPIFSASKHSEKEREPLFLPSSPSSQMEDFPVLAHSSSETPSIQNKGEAHRTTDSETVVIPHKKKRNFAYVLVPSPPSYLIRYRRRQAQKEKSIISRLSSRSSSSTRYHSREKSLSVSVGGGAEISRLFESQRNSPLDDEEREAIKLSSSRLQKLSCRWDGCDYQLNSVDSLLLHLALHMPQHSSINKTFMCRWTQCGQSGTHFKDGHIARHALLPLRCAYLNCDGSFRFGSQLLKHFKTRHKDGILKPSAVPSPPVLPPLTDIPHVVPSYIFATNPVGHKALSNERHQVIGKWVATNIIYSDQDVHQKKRPKKAARSTNRNAMNVGDVNNDYEFLKTRTTRPSTYSSEAVEMLLEDLDSAEISRMFASGLTLWGSGDEESDDNHALGSLPPSAESPLSAPQQLEQWPDTDIKEEEESEGLMSYGGVENHRQHVGSDVEDAAVESMLTGMALT